MTLEECELARDRALDYLHEAGVIVTEEEAKALEVTDLGLGDLECTGIQLLVYVNTQRCCAKEIVLFPRQTCPEHRHPAVGGEPGKEETFRCRMGKVYLYVPGEPSPEIHAILPEGLYTVWHEIELNPGDQYTIMPDTLHWFQAGDQGAVVSEFSTRSTDENDVFSDPRIRRL